MLPQTIHVNFHVYSGHTAMVVLVPPRGNAPGRVIRALSGPIEVGHDQLDQVSTRAAVMALLEGAVDLCSRGVGTDPA